MDAYPPNSKTRRPELDPEKNVKQVTSATATVRKKPLGKQFRETFIGGDLRTTIQYMVLDVMLPAAKDMIVDASSQGVERLVFGEVRRGRRPPTGAAPGQTQARVLYNQMHQSALRAPEQRKPKRPARSVMDFDEIQIASRSEAEEVIERLFDMVSQYGSVSVADLYSMVGLVGSHTDNKWGWTDLRGSGVNRLRTGEYVLNLPDPSTF